MQVFGVDRVVRLTGVVRRWCGGGGLCLVLRPFQCPRVRTGSRSDTEGGRAKQGWPGVHSTPADGFVDPHSWPCGTSAGRATQCEGRGIARFGGVAKGAEVGDHVLGLL